jgi:hypothetical protein
LEVFLINEEKFLPFLREGGLNSRKGIEVSYQSAVGSWQLAEYFKLIYKQSTEDYRNEF